MVEPALPQRQRSSALCPEWPEVAKKAEGFLQVIRPAPIVGTGWGSGMRRWPRGLVQTGSVHWVWHGLNRLRAAPTFVERGACAEAVCLTARTDDACVR